MSTQYLSKYKAELLTEMLLEPIKKEYQQAYQNINKVIIDILYKYINPKILEFYKEFPDAVKSAYEFSFKMYTNEDKSNSEWYYVNFKNKLPYIELLPYIESMPDDVKTNNEKDIKNIYMYLIKKDECDKNMFEQAIIDCIIIKEKKDKLLKQLRCAINNCKTYNKLKENFPEAYKILIEKVDENSLPNTTNCDNIESVRAILSTYNK